MKLLTYAAIQLAAGSQHSDDGCLVDPEWNKEVAAKDVARHVRIARALLIECGEDPERHIGDYFELIDTTELVSVPETCKPGHHNLMDDGKCEHCGIDMGWPGKKRTEPAEVYEDVSPGLTIGRDESGEVSVMAFRKPPEEPIHED